MDYWCDRWNSRGIVATSYWCDCFYTFEKEMGEISITGEKLFEQT